MSTWNFSAERCFSVMKISKYMSIHTQRCGHLYRKRGKQFLISRPKILNRNWILCYDNLRVTG